MLVKRSVGMNRVGSRHDEWRFGWLELQWTKPMCRRSGKLEAALALNC